MDIVKPRTPVSALTELAATTGTDVGTYTHEPDGVRAFAGEDGIVYHTYSSYARGVDPFLTSEQCNGEKR
jgi:predicted dithiol-disulfide oxidoreductase (DUF899 family)